MEPLFYAPLLLTIWIKVTSGYYDGFYFFNSWFRRTGEEVCKVCYGDNDCYTLNQARCEYYTTTNEVLAEDEGPEDSEQPELRSHVDALMSSMMERASQSPAYVECIPFVSQYTDCNKENICLGCVTCSCSAHGVWNCSSTKLCRPEEPLRLDHRALVFAMETLRGDGTPSFRLKRSLTTHEPRTPRRMTYAEIHNWMYDLNTTSDTASTTEPADTQPMSLPDFGVNYIFNNVGDNISNTETDYLAFDEVMNYMEDQNSNNTVTTIIINNGTTVEHDYMNIDDMNISYNEIKGFVTTEDDQTPVTITADPLELKSDKMEVNLQNNIRDKNVSADELPQYNFNMFDDTNDIQEINAVNIMKRAMKIMKRDVSQVTKLDNKTSSLLSGTNTTETSLIDELDDGVYQPLNKVIDDKQQELEDLLKIKEKLADILIFNNTKEFVVNLNKTEAIDKINSSHYSFYNVDIQPEMDTAFKRSNVNELDKYLKKLKRDIFTVMKDVAVIQRLTVDHNIPDGMKGLIRAMKHYIHKHNKPHTDKQKPEKEIYDARRILNVPMDKNTPKDFIIEILQLLDNNVPQNHALSPLSTKTRTVMRRILRNNKFNEYSVLGGRINDPNYNLTNDLKSIGLDWEAMTTKIANSSPYNRLYNMKMLHIYLESDICRLNDALALVDFAHSRRMVTFSDDIQSNAELSRIADILKSIKNNVNKIITYKKNTDRKKEVNKIVKFITHNQEDIDKKETFLNHIKNLIKTSKRDILKLLHKKVPKTNIIKELAKKKLDELTKKKMMQYETVMHKWQDHMEVNGRQKRSAFSIDLIKQRISNILPKYLRGKVNGKINSTRKSNKSKKQNKKSHGRKHKKNNRKHNATTALPIAIPLNNKTA